MNNFWIGLAIGALIMFLVCVHITITKHIPEAYEKGKAECEAKNNVEFFLPQTQESDCLYFLEKLLKHGTITFEDGSTWKGRDIR